jgi:hypothetical protein
MFKQALADNADIEVFSPLTDAFRPITLNVTSPISKKLTPKNWTT